MNFLTITPWDEEASQSFAQVHNHIVYVPTNCSVEGCNAGSLTLDAKASEAEVQWK